MTREEAVNRLERFVNYYHVLIRNGETKTVDMAVDNYFIEPMNMAIEALKEGGEP